VGLEGTEFEGELADGLEGVPPNVLDGAGANVLPVVGEPVDGEKDEDPPVEPVEYVGATRDAGMRNPDEPTVVELLE